MTNWLDKEPQLLLGRGGEGCLAERGSRFRVPVGENEHRGSHRSLLQRRFSGFDTDQTRYVVGENAKQIILCPAAKHPVPIATAQWELAGRRDHGNIKKPYGMHDLPPLRLTVTEHQVEIKQCPISGCFRTLFGAQVFARIRSYLSTCRKQGRNLWEACYQVAIGQPFMPNTPSADP